MTSLEAGLREVLNKHGFDCYRISIIFTQTGRDIMAIEIENIEEKTIITKGDKCKENK